jgi:hypothetical protein
LREAPFRFPVASDEALTARKALKSLLRNCDARLDHLLKKNLSSFIFGTDAFLLPPEMSTRVLSHLVSPTDVSGLFDRVQISAGSNRLLIDNIRMRLSAWACEASCASQIIRRWTCGRASVSWQTAPRVVQCGTSDLLGDASFDVGSRVTQKVSMECASPSTTLVTSAKVAGTPDVRRHCYPLLPFLASYHQGRFLNA